jgi:hypothetical protein
MYVRAREARSGSTGIFRIGKPRTLGSEQGTRRSQVGALYDEQIFNQIAQLGVTSSTGWFRPDELYDGSTKAARREFNHSIARLTSQKRVRVTMKPAGGYAWISLAGNKTPPPAA